MGLPRGGQIKGASQAQGVVNGQVGTEGDGSREGVQRRAWRSGGKAGRPSVRGAPYLHPKKRRRAGSGGAWFFSETTTAEQLSEELLAKAAKPASSLAAWATSL